MDSKTIRDMLSAVRSERKRIAERDKVLSEREVTLLDWLKEESPEQESLAFGGAEVSKPAQTPLSRFLVETLKVGVKQTTDELSALALLRPELAERYKVTGPGRAINFTLQGWKRYGLVHQDKDKRWFMKEGR